MFLPARTTENEIPAGRQAAARHVTAIVNPDDDQADRDEVTQLVERWRDGDDPVDLLVLGARGLPHDLIDPDQPAGDVAQVHPVVVGLLAADMPAGS